MVPVELQAIPATADFSIEREIGGWRIDNCFTGWNGHAVVGYPDALRGNFRQCWP